MTESAYNILRHQSLCNGVCNSKGWFTLTDLTTARERRRPTWPVAKLPVTVCRQMWAAVPTTHTRKLLQSSNHSSAVPLLSVSVPRLKTCDTHILVDNETFLIIKPTTCTNSSNLFFE